MMSVSCVIRRAAYLELGADLHAHGQVGQALDGVFSQEPGMVGRAAGDNDHAPELAYLLLREAQLGRSIVPLSASTLDIIASFSERGCSWISLSM